MAATYTFTFTSSPNLPITVNFDKANSVPVNIGLNINMAIEITGGFEDAYDELYLQLVVTNPAAGSVVLLSGDLPDAPGQRIPVYPGSSNPTVITLDFSNFPTIPNGTHQTKLSLALVGKNTSEPEYYLLGGVMDNIDAVITGAGSGEPPVEEIGITPESLIFAHALDQALPASQTVEVVSDGAFTASVFGPVLLSGPSLTLTQVVNGVREYAGTASQTVTVSLSPEVANLSADTYEYMVAFSQSGSKSAFIGSLGITLYLFETSELVIHPAALEFFAIKGIQEAPSQTINVAGEPAFTLTRPSWLIVTPTSGQGFTEVTVTPNPSSTLAEGTYTGDIIFNDGTNDYIVSVLHNVYGNVQLGMSPTKLNFTGDYNTISRFYEQENYRLELQLAVDYYNYGLTLLNQTTLNYILGFFNNRTEFFVGKTLNGVMKQMLELKSISMDTMADGVFTTFKPIRNYYLPARVDMTALFKHDFDDDLDKTHLFEDIKFIKGRRPKTPFDDTYILDYYRDPLRVTVNSVAMFNFYKEKNHVFRIYKNGKFFGSISHNVGTQRIFGYKSKFNMHSPGDVVEFRLYKNIDGAVDEAWFDYASNYIAQRYIVIPEGMASHHIGYEDEYGLLKIIEFTGVASFDNDYDNLIAKNYEEFLETSKKLDSKKTAKCTINTGHIFKANVRNIDELLKSNRAWIISNQKKKSISMIPTTKSMSDMDTDRDLYSYDIEFDINFNNDFEVNT